MEQLEVTLPHGLNIAGAWQRAAALHPLTGSDESYLLESRGALFPAQRTTALLTRCLTRIGTLDTITPHVVQALTVGDREALLLHLHRTTRGDKLECVLSCPNPACREKLEVELEVNDLLHPPYPEPREVYQVTAAADDKTYHARFRLPNGADQEAAARVAAYDVDAAAQVILERCIESITSTGDGVSALDTSPSAVANTISDAMAQLDPQAEIVLHFICPACKTELDTPFDAGDFLYRELFHRSGDLYRQVHLLAYHYHWSESEIMSMTEHNRRMYLGLLLEQIGAKERV